MPWSSVSARRARPSGRLRRLTRLATLAISPMVQLATLAAAHEGEQAKTAIDDVRQPLVYIVNAGILLAIALLTVLMALVTPARHLGGM